MLHKVKIKLKRKQPSSWTPDELLPVAWWVITDEGIKDMVTGKIVSPNQRNYNSAPC